jgi:peptidyl-prolyl cis-trans isomerase B (cyclophilin B)
MKTIKTILLLVLVSTTLFFLTGCKDKSAVTHVATIEMNDGGIIVLELYGNMAPITVKNFTKLANDGFYDGLIFHRVIENFMIQGGDPQGDGSGGSGKNIKGEFSENKVKNTITHDRGVISMARGDDVNSASSQFFIVHEDSHHLDGNYAGFGRVTSGIEVVDYIAAAMTVNEKPINNQTIKTIRVEKK